MSRVTLNDDLEVIELRLSIPRVGVWHAVASVAVESNAPKSVDLTIGDQLALHGHVVRQGPAFDTQLVDFVGGSGDMGAAAKARAYRGATVRTVLGDLMSDAGESASGAIPGSVLSRQLDRWSITGGRSVGAELVALVDAVLEDGAWRMLADGTVWIGEETWPASTFTYDIVSLSPSRRQICVVSDDPFPMPGEAVDGVDWPNLSYVLHEQLNGELRTTMYFEDT